MTDNGRKALRIPVYDKTPTPRPAPSTIPEVEIESLHPRDLHIKFRSIHAARWESGTMKKSPWSDIYSAIIP
jgi:hypothetical protein